MKRIVSFALVATLALSASQVAFAHQKKHHCNKHKCKNHKVVADNTYKGEVAPVIIEQTNYFTPNWYAGGSIGESRTHDGRTAGIPSSVTQIGPGWNVDLGYQFVEVYKFILAGELGYTSYHNSNETVPGANIAYTEHFSTYLAAVAQYPLIHNFSVLGKLGVAYSYAKKTFNFAGLSGSGNAYSPYYGIGLAYNFVPSTALQLQWDRARGNSKTGSTDLISFGITHSFL